MVGDMMGNQEKRINVVGVKDQGYDERRGGSSGKLQTFREKS